MEVIREDEPEYEDISEYVSSPPVDLNTTLQQAEDLLLKNQKPEALKLFHTVFDRSLSDELRKQALRGMASIGDPQSLPRLAKYAKDRSPILWNYRPPDEGLIQAANQVYEAVATRMVDQDPERAKKMLTYALTLVQGMDDRQVIIDQFQKLGINLAEKAESQGYLSRWHLLGPFPWTSAQSSFREQLHRNEIPPGNVSRSADVTFANQTYKWRQFLSEAPMVDLLKWIQPNLNVSVYAYAEFVLDREQDIYLKVGSDDAFICWFNGEEAGRFESDREWKADEDVLSVHGRRGVNRVLLKIVQGTQEWAFSARLNDRNHDPILTREP